LVIGATFVSRVAEHDWPRWFTAASGRPRDEADIFSSSAPLGRALVALYVALRHITRRPLGSPGVAFFRRDAGAIIGREAMGLRLLCNLLRPAHTLPLLYAYHRESNSERIISSPDYATLSNIIASNLQREFIWNGISSHTCDLCAAIRKAAQDTRAGQVAFRVVDCCRRVPLDPKVLAPLAWHSRIPIAAFQPIT
jgi:hypothetical protein